MPSSMPPVEVTLRSVDHLDELDKRTIVIRPNQTIPIGRSSKNTSKRLLAAPDNVYIDSPVISRDHAELTASTPLGVPTVYIKDKGAMHGTHVNGLKMDKESIMRLNDGDTLQFGVDVVRDQETFIAKKYHFNLRLAAPEPESLFPRGVSVPSVWSSEDEDDEIEEVEEETFVRAPLRVPNYGSQYNPVNVDDFGDDEQDIETHNEIVDLVDDDDEDDEDDEPPPAYVTPKRTESVLEQERQIPGSPALPHPNAANSLSEAAPPPTQDPKRFNEDNISEVEFSDQFEDDAGSIDMSIDHDHNEENYLSENESGFSGIESYSEPEHSDASEDENEDENTAAVNAAAVCRAKLAAMVRDAQNKVEEVAPAPIPVPTLNPADTINSSPSAPLHAGPSLPESARYVMDPNPPMPFGSRLMGRDDEPDRYKVSESEAMPVMSEDFNPWMTDSTVPPRPPAPVPKPMGMWYCSASSMGYNTAPSLMRPTQDPWLDEPPANPFVMPFNDFRNDSLPPFDRAFVASGPQVSFTPNSYETRTEQDQSHESQQAVDAGPAMGVPTPPMACPEVPSMVTPQQTPRTKVSIAEIVEELPQQPLTPASMATPPSKKRKADALEAEEEEKAEEESTPVATEADSAKTVAPVEVQRPKKRLRRALHLAGTAAIGAAAVVGGLMYLPHGFFDYLD